MSFFAGPRFTGDRCGPLRFYAWSLLITLCSVFELMHTQERMWKNVEERNVRVENKCSDRAVCTTIDYCRIDGCDYNCIHWLHWLTALVYTVCRSVGTVRPTLLATENDTQRGRYTRCSVMLSIAQKQKMVRYFLFGQNLDKYRKLWIASLNSLKSGNSLNFSEFQSNIDTCRLACVIPLITESPESFSLLSQTQFSDVLKRFLLICLPF